MKLLDVITGVAITEANIAAKIIKDHKITKMLSIAWRHDNTLPPSVVAHLGPRPTEQSIVQAWSKLLDDTLRRNDYGDLSADGKFDDWLTRLYINGQADYEDINGEGGDALGAWKALSIRGLLKPQDQDFNRFTSIKQLQRIRNDRDYRRELDRIKDSERIEKMKREKSDLVLIDNDRYYVIIPFNYGACYIFGNAEGYKPNFCTSSSSGLHWFENYAPRGIIVSIVDKNNINDKNGKWQFHAATNQLVNADQENRHDLRGNDEKFSKLFPGLMKQIADAILANADQIKEMSKDFVSRGGYDAASEVESIKTKYPLSYNSQKEKTTSDEPAGDEPETEDGAGNYRVTKINSNRFVDIPAENREDVIAQIMRRHPGITRDQLEDPEQFTIERLPNQEPAGG
jgi:hypothetical protein